MRIPYRLLVVPAAVLMAMCLGSTYAWSAFVQPIKDATGVDQARAQFPFSVFYFVFPLTALLQGFLPARVSPRLRAVVGGLLFGGGWVFAGLGGPDMRLTIAGVGVIGGVGVGLAYLVPIATCIAWFPRHKGLVTGIAIAGFGGGAALVGRLADGMIAGSGMSPYAALRLFGVSFALLIGLAALTMRRPDEAAEAHAAPLPWRSFLGAPAFWLLYATFFAGLAAGLGVNGNLKHLAAGGAAASGAAPIAWFALANAAGRILWGRLSDRVAPVPVLAANLVVTAALFGAASFVLGAPGGVGIFAALAGFDYGGVLVLHPTLVARQWGRADLMRIYGVLFTANIPAAVMPAAAGWAYERTGSFVAPLGVLAALLVAAALALRRFRSHLTLPH